MDGIDADYLKHRQRTSEIKAAFLETLQTIAKPGEPNSTVVMALLEMTIAAALQSKSEDTLRDVLEGMLLALDQGEDLREHHAGSA